MRRRSALVVLAVVLITASWISGCGGGASGTGPSSNRIKFVHSWFYLTDNSNVHVTIDVCSQDFFLDPGDQKLVECNPDEDIPSFLVKVEGWIAGLSYISDAPTIWEGQVSSGQTVVITGELASISVAVED